MENEPKSPWSTVWFDPQTTIHTILETRPYYHHGWLILLGGIAQTLSVAATMGLGEKMSNTQIMLFALVMGGVSGWLTLAVRGLILKWIGGWLGGTASFRDVRICLAWSWAPMVYFLPLWAVKIILFKQETFLLKRPVLEAVPLLRGLFGFLEFADFAIYIWSLIILVQMFAAINKFSGMRSLASVVISGLVLSIPALLILFFLAPAAQLM